ncbi:hypothetical protein EUC41_09165 [Achromobacter denitrificans]|uniref:hypothetical protein n=1 Tax=Achromobacter denitrificans TaxID=32002 RepID=UPI00240D1936|nr:hypothetical protein [Achromobacter denitrificans]WFC66469.1 hypothetical protein EUC41_09165 [Achromobacter denitrificans]
MQSKGIEMTNRAEFERLLDVYGFRCERFGQDLSTHARAQVVSAFAALLRAPVAPAPDGFVPVAASVLRTLAEPGLIKRTLGKFSPALAAKLGFTPEEEKAIEAMYLAFGESFDYPCAPLASAPVSDTLPLEKALHELVSKIAPGLDTGDILQDARQASAMLGTITASASVAGEAQPVGRVRHFNYSGIARNGFSQEAVLNDDAPSLMGRCSMLRPRPARRTI